MFVPPPRVTGSSLPIAAPMGLNSMPFPGSSAGSQHTLGSMLRNVQQIQQNQDRKIDELYGLVEKRSTSPLPVQNQTTGSWFDSLSRVWVEALTTGITVALTLMIREWYAQYRLGQTTQESAHAALSGFPRFEQNELQNMTTEKLEQQAKRSSDEFLASDPPTNLKAGIMARDALEMLLTRKDEQLKRAQVRVDEAEAEGDEFILNREKQRTQVLYDDIVEILAEWQTISDAVEKLRHEEIYKFGQLEGYEGEIEKLLQEAELD